MKSLISRLHPGHMVFLVLIPLGILFPDTLPEWLSAFTTWFTYNFGWLVMLVCAAFVGCCIFITFSSYGRLKLGKPDEQPAYGMLSWLAMLFAAGMGTGLVFYGAAEPLMHFVNPPPSAAALADEASRARRAMAITYFHWGIHAWAIYAMAALTIAYFSFRHDEPMLPSVSVSSHQGVMVAVNSMAIMAVVFGVVASLCQGVLQLSDGIIRVMEYSSDDIMLVQVGVLAMLCLSYTLSACTGLGKGIKILSNINMGIAVTLLVFILFASSTRFIMQGFVSGIGDYLDGFLRMSFDMRHFSDDSGWMGNWTITLLIWWIAWAPFVGVFVARISRGRTLREFMLGVVLAPTGFSFIWFATLGGGAIHLEMFDLPGFGAIVSQPERVTFAMLDALPLAEITSLMTLLLLFIFLVTSADSGTYVLGMFTCNGSLQPPRGERLFWGAMIGAVSIGAVLTGKGTMFFRSLAVFGGIPYLFIMVWQIGRLWKAMTRDLTHNQAVTP